jgi:hypothetical protein
MKVPTAADRELMGIEGSTALRLLMLALLWKTLSGANGSTGRYPQRQ